MRPRQAVVALSLAAAPHAVIASFLRVVGRRWEQHAGVGANWTDPANVSADGKPCMPAPNDKSGLASNKSRLGNRSKLSGGNKSRLGNRAKLLGGNKSKSFHNGSGGNSTHRFPGHPNATSQPNKTKNHTFPRIHLSNVGHGSCLPYGLSWDEVRCVHFGWKRATTRKRRVIDAFAYNGETDVVEVRRREMANVVNGTALLITKLNFKGNYRDPPSPPHGGAIEHSLLPAEAFDVCRDKRGVMDRECSCSMTKNSVADVVEQFGLHDDDWVLFGDPDEIPNREAVRLLQQCEIPVGPGHANKVIHFSVLHHYYYDFRCRNNNSKWGFLNHKTPAAVRVSTMREYGLRVLQAQRAPACVRVGRYNSCSQYLRHRSVHLPCAAWHLSSFGGLQQLTNKTRDNADIAHVHLEQFHQCTLQHSWRELVDKAPEKYPDVPHSVQEDPMRFHSLFHAE